MNRESNLTSTDLAWVIYLSFLAHPFLKATTRRTLATILIASLIHDTDIISNPTDSAVPDKTAQTTASTSNNLSTSREGLIARYTLALREQKRSPNTIKNYISDVDTFLAFYASLPLSAILTKPNTTSYTHLLEKSGLSRTTIERKMSAIRGFAHWAAAKGFIHTDPFPSESLQSGHGLLPGFHITKSYKPSPQATSNNNPATTMKAQLARAYERYHSYRFTSYLHLSILVVAAMAMGFLGYTQIMRNTRQSLAFPTSLNRPNRALSFQARLTDASSTPITASTNLVFKLWTLSSGGSQLWTSGTCSITPDSNGIFSTLLGNTCGSEITSDVFSENSNVWLEITVGAETLTPRQQIATVGYALNSETLQGYPAADPATTNSIPVINNAGQMVLSAASPLIKSTSGTFGIAGNAVTVSTNTGTNGNIQFAPDGTGQVKVLGGTTSTDTFTVSNASLTTGNLITGSVANNNTGYKLISLQSGSSPTEKFSVDALGNVTEKGYFSAPGATISATYSSATPLIVNGTGGQIFSIANSGTVTIGGYTTNKGLLYTDASGVVSQTAQGAANTVLHGNGTSAPSFSAIDLTADVSGTLPINKGGTNGTATPTNGGIAYGTGTAYAFTAAGVASQCLVSNGAAAPTWATCATGSSGTNYWQLNTQVISPGNSTFDLAIGGTATSSALFQVFGTSGNATTSGSFTFAGTNAANIIAARNNSGLTLGDSQTGNIILNQNGNVAIGTTLPTAAFDVNGTASISSSLTFRTGAATIQSTANNLLTIGGGTTGNIQLRPSNGTGIVSIGTAVFPSSSVLRLLVGAASTGDSLATAMVNANGPGSKGLIVQGSTNQTSNLFENQNNSGTVLSAFDAKGNLSIGTGVATAPLLISAGLGSNAALITNNLNSGDLFTASASGTTKFTINNNGNIQATGTITGLTGITSSGTITLSGLSTDKGIVYTNGTGGVLAQTAQGAANTVLHGNGTSAPSFSAIDLTADVTGTLPINKGGTNGTATPTNGGVAYGTGTAYAFTAAGTTNQCLVSNGAAAPTWSACAAGTSNLWQLNTQVISPGNSTFDLAIGGTATSSALFQVFGNTGSATTSGTFTFAGTNANNLIAARNKAGLTLGDSQTGNIILNGGNVGIGTTVPVGVLTVKGAASNTVPIYRMTDGTVNASFYIGSSEPKAQFGTETNNDLSFYTNNTNRIRIFSTGGIAIGTGSTVDPGATNLSVAGNIGIGTTTPGSALAIGATSQFQINSSGAITAATGITSSGAIQFSAFTTDKGLLYTNGSGILSQTAQGAANTVLHGNGTTAPSFSAIDLAADVTGTLPINRGGTNGTATPTNGGIAYGTGTAYAFSAAGSSNQCLISNGAAAPTWVACASGTSNVWQLNSPVISPANSTYDMAIGGTSTASAKFLVQGTTGFTTIGTGLTAQAPLYISSGFGANAAMIVNNLNSGDLFAASSSGTTRFRIDNSGNAIAATFQDSANTAYYLDPANAGVSLAAAGDATAGGKLIIGGTSGIIQPADGSLTLNYKSAINTWAAGITLQPTTGNVGILNINPKTVLDITGTASVSSTLTLGGALQPSNGPLTFKYKSGLNTWAAGMTLDTVGNLGIGVGNAAPTNLVDIASAVRSGTQGSGLPFYATGNVGAASSGFEFRHSNGTSGIGIGYNALYAAGSSTNQDLSIMPKGTGNVGIGISSGMDKLLYVNGTARVKDILTVGLSGALYGTLDSETNLYLNIDSDSNESGAAFHFSTDRSYISGGTELMTILDTGNVGIGSTNPGQALDVAGNIITSAGGRKHIIGDITVANSGLYFNTASDSNYYIGRDGTSWGAGQPINYSSFYGHVFTYAGTTTQALKIDSVGIVTIGSGQSATSSAVVQNTDTGTDGDGLAIKLGFTSSVGGSCNTNGACNEFVTFMNGNGLKLGKIYASAASGANTVTYKTNGNDMAEFFKKQASESFEPGDIVSMYANGAAKPAQESDPKILGIVTTTPGFVGGDDDGNSVLVALVGQVPLKIDPASEPIEKGDLLTSSETKGMAKKATGPGYVVGKALEAWDPSQGQKKISTFIHVGYMDPDRSLDASLSLNNLVSFADVMDPSAPYTLNDAAGKQIRHVIRASHAAIANLTAGFIQTKQLVADSIRVGGVTLEQYIKNVVQTIPQGTGHDIAKTVDPHSGIENLMITLGSDATSSAKATLKITDRALQTVASIDEAGNASFAGTLQATNLQVNDASIAGVLYANQIDGLKEKVASLVSGEIASTSAELMASLAGNNSAILDRVSLLEDKTHPIASGSSLLAADTLFISDSINVAGNADLGSAIIHAGLTVGNTLSVTGSSLETSEQTLSLQPSGMGRINMLAGAMTLDSTSGLVVGVNAVFAKNVTVLEDLITSSIKPTENLTIQFATNSGALNNRFAIQDQAGVETASINSRGDASFNKLIIASDNTSSSASISGELHTNATTGGAVLPVGATTFTIVSNQITANSRIYVTPTSSTNNQVLYVSSVQGVTATTEGKATIAIDAALAVPLSFNWWIIN